MSRRLLVLIALTLCLCLLPSLAPVRAEPPSDPQQADGQPGIAQAMEAKQRRLELEALRPSLTKLAEPLADSATGVPGVQAAGHSQLVADPPIVRDGEGKIQVYVVARQASDLTPANLDALRRLGFDWELTSQPMGLWQGYLPEKRLERAASLPFVREITLPGYAMSDAGSVATEGDALLNTDQVRARGITGAGTRVAVISDGVSHAASAQATGDLPAHITVLPGIAGDGDEGTAMLEIVHDIAPGAQLGFAGPRTSAEMIQAIDAFSTNAFAGQRADVIVDDLNFFDQPAFEDGPIAQAAARAYDRGSLYVSSVGNYQGQHWMGPFTSVDGDQFHEWASNNDEVLDVVVAPGASTRCVLQWNEPFGAASSDYDMYAVTLDGRTLIAASQTHQNGKNNPVEAFTVTNTGSSTAAFGVVVAYVRGSEKFLKLHCYRSVSIEYPTGGSIGPTKGAAKIMAVGAIGASDLTMTAVEEYSSRGPAIYNFFGDPIERKLRIKPDITAVDCVRVTGAGGFGGSGKRFCGTSAAAPHTAAVAALVKQANPTFSAPQLWNRLISTARDIGDPGPDNVSGAGVVDALAANGGVSTSPTPGASPSPVATPSAVATPSNTPNQTPFRVNAPVVLNAAEPAETSASTQPTSIAATPAAGVDQVIQGLWYQQSSVGPVIWQFETVSGVGSGFRETFQGGNFEIPVKFSFVWQVKGNQLFLQFPSGRTELYTLTGYDATRDMISQSGPFGDTPWYGCHSGQMPLAIQFLCSTS